MKKCGTSLVSVLQLVADCLAIIMEDFLTSALRQKTRTSPKICVLGFGLWGKLRRVVL